MISSAVIRTTIFVACVLVIFCGYMALRGPQGVPAFLEKRHEIRQLEEENANLRRDIDSREKLIHELQFSQDKQDEVIRRYLHEGKANEVQFILPDKPGSATAPPQAPARPQAR